MATTGGPSGTNFANLVGNTITTNGVYITGGGSGGGYYGGMRISPGTVSYPNTTTFGPINGPITGDPFGDLLRGGSGRNRLSQMQIERLMDHEFIPMEESGHPYCLLCFALDVYRTQVDHEFVIHEE